MPVLDLYSDRMRAAQGKTPDVYVYDRLPVGLKNQIVHILREAIGGYHVHRVTDFGKIIHNNKAWEWIHKEVAKAHGLLALGNKLGVDQNCEIYFLQNESVEACLDMVEVCFIYIDSVVRKYNRLERLDLGIQISADSAIKELNERFRRAGVGYQFVEGRIVRIDSELIHAEVVMPALRYLNESGFDGPRDEFMRAHSHYRSGEIEDAITDANNAFESTLKVICDKRGWEYPSGARASDLLRIVRNEGLFPSYLDNSFDQLYATLKNGLPKLRSEEGAHGQGPEPRRTPEYMGSYALHLAATNILFLVEAHKDKS